MKKIILFCLFCFSAAISFAQKDTFDLITYTAPKTKLAGGLYWEKEETKNAISYIVANKKNNPWCRVSIIKSTISKGSIEKDFESEWQELIVKNYRPTEAPQVNAAQEADGWKIKAGTSKFIFNNSDAIAMLTTVSGYNRCGSIIAITNSQDYLKDIEALLASVDLIKPEIISAQVPNSNEDEGSIIGTWCISASDNSNFRMKNGIISTIYRQYTFKKNGSYTCYIKTFDPIMSSIFLGREAGTYQISGNNLTINPQKSLLEEWSKKNNAGQWGNLLKTQNINLEKVTYRFTKIYVPENNEWQLILKSGNPTRRDGPFNNNDRNAWIYIITSPARPVIKLPG